MDDIDNIDSNSHSGVKSTLKIANVKLLIMMFFLFIFIVSNFFGENVIGMLGKNFISGRTPTQSGIVVQATCFVFIYILMVYIVNAGYI